MVAPRAVAMTLSLNDAPTSQLAGLNAFDWLLLVVLAWSVISGLVRGIIREIFGLAGMILALLLASWNYNALAVRLSRWITSFVAAEITAFILIVVVILTMSALLGRLLRGTAHTVGLGFLDRLTGAIFGLLRGSLLAIIVLMAVTAFFPPQTLVAESRLAPYFLAAAREVCFVVPQDLQRRITGSMDRARRIAQRETQRR